MVDQLPESIGPEVKVVAFVHAKGTSERLPGKNLRMLGDRPLVCHAIRNALKAKLVDAVVIDSDDDEILRVGVAAGAIPLKRPAELATNATTGDDLIVWQASNVPLAEAIVQVVPTSPFVLPESIDHGVTCLGKWDSATGIRSDKLYRWEYCQPCYRRHGKIPNSVDLIDTTWETGGLYAMRAAYVREHGLRVAAGLRIVGMELSHTEAIDIDTEGDFIFAEIVWKGLQC